VAALRLLVPNGARRGEVLNATCDQFNLSRGVWPKLSRHTKGKKTEHVLLSAETRLLVSRLREARDQFSGHQN
jgi:integrase